MFSLRLLCFVWKANPTQEEGKPVTQMLIPRWSQHTEPFDAARLRFIRDILSGQREHTLKVYVVVGDFRIGACFAGA